MNRRIVTAHELGNGRKNHPVTPKGVFGFESSGDNAQVEMPAIAAHLCGCSFDGVFDGLLDSLVNARHSFRYIGRFARRQADAVLEVESVLEHSDSFWAMPLFPEAPSVLKALRGR